MIRGRGVAKNIIDFAIFSGLGGTGCLSEVAAVMPGIEGRRRPGEPLAAGELRTSGSKVRYRSELRYCSQVIKF